MSQVMAALARRLRVCRRPRVGGGFPEPEGRSETETRDLPDVLRFGVRSLMALGRAQGVGDV